MSRTNASNWVDRGDSAIPKISQSLAYYFERIEESGKPWLDEQATIVFGMVAGDANEVQIASYLRGVVREMGSPTRQPLGTRHYAISIWHIAKVALIRDHAERVLRGEVHAVSQIPGTLGSWLAERLMTPAELERYNQQGAQAHDADSTGAYAD